MSRDADVAQIYKKGSSANTRVALSMKNRVYSKPYTKGTSSFKQVGVLSTFSFNESRSVDPVRGVGFGDRIVELVPGVTEPMSLTLNRTLMYTASIVQEVGYRGGVDGLVRSLRHHRWPFDIKSELVFSELVTRKDDAAILIKTTDSEGRSLALVTFFEACWIESYSVDFPSDSAIVLEDCSAKATDVTDGTSMYGSTSETYGDFLDAGNNPFLQNNAGSELFK